MSCLKMYYPGLLAGVISRCLPRGLGFGDSECPYPMIVVFLFYRHGISTSCQTNSINVLNI